jgi:ubiquinol-cytochrome c reductase cytochrome c subunit
VIRRHHLARLLLVGLAFTAALAAAGCSYTNRQVAPYRPPTYYREAAPKVVGEEQGRELYLRDCSFCHNSEGQGTDNGPTLREGTNGAALTDFMLRTGRMPLDNPEAESMRKKPVYTDKEIRAIVHYVVRAFQPPGPGIPAVHPAAGDLSAGQQLYEQNCAACHAATGIGGAMLTQQGRNGRGHITGVYIPSLEEADGVEIAEAVRTGPGTMPLFGPELVTDDEVNSLVRYVLYLQEPRDAGGFPIGHVGPVAEGAFGWAFGLGALILFIRWVGTKVGEQP